jgi:hypothetical protein
LRCATKYVVVPKEVVNGVGAPGKTVVPFGSYHTNVLPEPEVTVALNGDAGASLQYAMFATPGGEGASLTVTVISTCGDSQSFAFFCET